MKCQMYRLIPASFLLCLSFASCMKKDSVPSSSQTTTQSLLMRATNDIFNAGNQQSQELADVIGSNGMVSGDSSDCRVVSYAPSRDIYPYVKTVDFGSGCASADGVTRRGKKIISVYADWRTAPAGTLISEATFSDFYIDSIRVEGNVKTYVDTAAVPGPVAFKVVSTKTLTSPNGDVTTFTATNYWLQTQGSDTPTGTDDVFQITGSATGNEVLDGVTSVIWSYNTDPAHPIIKDGDCEFRTQGALQIHVQIQTGGMSNFTEYLDYGNGACDNVATLSINGGEPQEVSLPLIFWPLSL
ncbi:MAG TPA: hypothetical protein VEV83_14255 [Parafilimonas sp.]|nr:hypothetical protein [Parafilimonas sp.]